MATHLTARIWQIFNCDQVIFQHCEIFVICDLNLNRLLPNPNQNAKSGHFSFFKFLFQLGLACKPSTTYETKMATFSHSQHNAIDWVALRSKLPPLDKSPESKAIRMKIFKQFDPNGNGYLILAGSWQSELAELICIKCNLFIYINVYYST